MKFVIATDEERPVVEHVAKMLRERGHEATVLPKAIWGAMATEAAGLVARGDYHRRVAGHEIRRQRGREPRPAAPRRIVSMLTIATTTRG
jgi:hypothetical protein